MKKDTMQSNNMIIYLQDVYKNYELGETVVHAVRGVRMEIEAGKFISLIGPSGCGKTTMLNMIGCIDTPSRGALYIDNNDVLSMSDNEITEYRGRSIGFIFQNFSLIPVMNVKENISYPLLLRKGTKYEISKLKIEERVNKIVEEVGLTQWMHHKPNELSGGQRQRVAIARALIGNPKLVIADEPTANLDSETSYTIMEMMRKLQQEWKTTFVFATHDFRFINYVDYIYEMDNGQIIDKRIQK